MKEPSEGITRAFNADMERCCFAYYSGERDMLFEAINFCGIYRAPLPDWVRHELQEGLRIWRSSKTREFGEAFGITPIKGQLPAAQKKYAKAWPVYQEIERLRTEGASMTNELWEEVAQRHGINRDLAKDYHKYIKDGFAAQDAEDEALRKRWGAE